MNDQPTPLKLYEDPQLRLARYGAMATFLEQKVLDSANYHGPLKELLGDVIGVYRAYCQSDVQECRDVEAYRTRLNGLRRLKERGRLIKEIIALNLVKGPDYDKEPDYDAVFDAAAVLYVSDTAEGMTNAKILDKKEAYMRYFEELVVRGR